MPQSIKARPTPGNAIKAGDHVLFAGRVHRVLAISRHFHPKLGQYRIARSDGGWWLGIYPSDQIQVMR